MSILYCRNCGAKIEYTLQKPIACYKCNKDLSAASLPKINMGEAKEENIARRRNPKSIRDISKRIKISAKDDGKNPTFKI
jgi:predicted NUDIX family NTP pyrophosphohydrolase